MVSTLHNRRVSMSNHALDTSIVISLTLIYFAIMLYSTSLCESWFCTTYVLTTETLSKVNGMITCPKRLSQSLISISYNLEILSNLERQLNQKINALDSVRDFKRLTILSPQIPYLLSRLTNKCRLMILSLHLNVASLVSFFLFGSSKCS
jgi:hypothetical protein